jgi:hypothetical protein
MMFYRINEEKRVRSVLPRSPPRLNLGKSTKSTVELCERCSFLLELAKKCVDEGILFQNGRNQFMHWDQYQGINQWSCLKWWIEKDEDEDVYTVVDLDLFALPGSYSMLFSVLICD